MRCLKNPYSREYFRKEYDGSVSDEELEALGVGALRKAAVEGLSLIHIFLQKARTEAAEILQQAKAEKVRQMEQMRDEMIEAKRQLGSMAGRIGNLSQELERFGVLLAQQNEGGSKEKA